MENVTNIEQSETGDKIVPVRIRAKHWDQLTGEGLPVNGHLQLVLQPDGHYGLRFMR